MPVNHVKGKPALDEAVSAAGVKLVVVDIGAAWCGPCQGIKPVFESLSAKYADVCFLAVDGDESADVMQAFGATAYPTFVFLLGGAVVDKMAGADAAQLEAKINEHKANAFTSFSGSGATAGGGGGGVPLSAEDARAARLKRFGDQKFGGASTAPKAAGAGLGGGMGASDGTNGAAAASMQDEEERMMQAALAASMEVDQAGAAPALAPAPAPSPSPPVASAAAAAAAPDVEMGDTPAAATPAAAPAAAAATAAPSDADMDAQAEAQMVAQEGADALAAASASPPAATKMAMGQPRVDAALLGQLVEMGFPDLRARKALLGGAADVAAAMDWLETHQDDAGIDEPIPDAPLQADGGGGGSGSGGGSGDGVTRSYRCVETGKLFSDMRSLQMYAEKTGRSDFEESCEEKKALTPEERAAKVAEMRKLIAQKTAAAQESDKKRAQQSELQRRSMGQQMNAAKGDLLIEQRKRDGQARKREKDAAKRERERLREEIARDKAERRARGGKLASNLGVDGYNPMGGRQVDTAGGFGGGAGAGDGGGKAAAPAAAKTPSEKVTAAIERLGKYRTGGDGLTALKTLAIFIKNVLTKPDEEWEKYSRINGANEKIKKRVGTLVGGFGLLVAVGFIKQDDGFLVMPREAKDAELLAETQAKIAAAVEGW